MRSHLVFVITALLFGFTNVLFAANPLDVSLLKLISNPNDYDGKLVRIKGFAALEFEGTSIYLHQEDYNQLLTRNGLWLAVSEDILKNQKKFDQNYVLVEGTFNAKFSGHLGLWSGSIQNITRFEVSSSRRTIKRR